MRHRASSAEGEVEEFLTSADAGRVVDLTPGAVRLAAKTGRLRIAAKTPSGQYLFRRADVEALARRRERERFR